MIDSLYIQHEDDLHIGWYGKKDAKIFTVYCKCGNTKFLKAEDGFRCLECSHFHSHDSWDRTIIKLNHEKFMNTGAVKEVPYMVVKSLKRQVIKVPRPHIIKPNEKDNLPM